MVPSLQYGPPPQFAQLPDASTRNYLASPCHVDLRYAPITATGRSNRPNSLITAGPPKSGWPNCSLRQKKEHQRPYRYAMWQWQKPCGLLGGGNPQSNSVVVAVPSLYLIGQALKCPEYQDEHYHNCYGIYTTADGSEYVGKFSNGKKRKYKKYANYNNEKTHTREYNWFGRNHYP